MLFVLITTCIFYCCLNRASELRRAEYYQVDRLRGEEAQPLKKDGQDA